MDGEREVLIFLLVWEWGCDLDAELFTLLAGGWMDGVMGCVERAYFEDCVGRGGMIVPIFLVWFGEKEEEGLKEERFWG